MVNFGWNSASILGVFLMVVGAGLYFLRSVRPELSRDYDIFFAAVGLACGGILIFNGWRLDPILQFNQFLLAGSTIFFAVESVRLRGVATEQARRSTPVVDDDRPVSRSYQAYREPEYSDYEQIEAYESERYVAPRQLRGTPEARSSRRDRQEVETRRSRPRPSSNGRDDYERPSRSRRSSRPPVVERYPDEPTAPPADAERYSERYDEWGEPYDAPTSRRPRPERDLDARPPRRRPRADERQDIRDEEPAPYVDYVDYRPDADDAAADDYDDEQFADDRQRPSVADAEHREDVGDEREHPDDGAADYDDYYDDEDEEDYDPRAGSEY
ncbi:MAG: hypothetical protein HC910_07555 [Spirulinaceae cyanobacterium SM2_1_0]|nr:hypothetical protein [Spirulinaceae cyanobacterium SM2_1_0]